MSCYDDPDTHVTRLNRRARLLREAADEIRPGADPSLADDLLREADAVATEAMEIVAWTGAGHGEAYYHDHDSDDLPLGWAPITWLEANQ